MPEPDRSERAFSFAQDTSKQVLVLATGIITITVALLGDLKKAAPTGAFHDLHIAWLLDGFSVLIGILTLMALTGHAARAQSSSEAIYSKNVAMLFILQFTSFVVALGFTIAFGIRAA